MSRSTSTHKRRTRRRRVRRRRVEKSGQLILQPPIGHGGRRPGAGRKALSGHPCESRHRRADPPTHDEGALHITMQVVKEVGNLRRQRCMKVLWWAFAEGRERFGFRLVHFAVQSNHIHLVAEVEGREALHKGMKGLSVRTARAVECAAGAAGAGVCRPVSRQAADLDAADSGVSGLRDEQPSAARVSARRVANEAAVGRPLYVGALLRRLAGCSGEAASRGGRWCGTAAGGRAGSRVAAGGGVASVWVDSGGRDSRWRGARASGYGADCGCGGVTSGALVRNGKSCGLTPAPTAAEGLSEGGPGPPWTLGTGW